MHTEKIRYSDPVLAGMSRSGAPLSLPGALAPIAPRWLRPWTSVTNVTLLSRGAENGRMSQWAGRFQEGVDGVPPHGGETGVRLFGWPTLLYDPDENNSVQGTLLPSV